MPFRSYINLDVSHFIKHLIGRNQTKSTSLLPTVTSVPFPASPCAREPHRLTLPSTIPRCPRGPSGRDTARRQRHCFLQSSRRRHCSPSHPSSPGDSIAPPTSPHHPAALAHTASAIPATRASRRPRHGHADTMPAPTLATTAPGLLSLFKPAQSTP
jgi:hypothetical protein